MNRNGFFSVTVEAPDQEWAERIAAVLRAGVAADVTLSPPGLSPPGEPAPGYLVNCNLLSSQLDDDALRATALAVLRDLDDAEVAESGYVRVRPRT
jgi:hypothetical protein